MKELIEKILEKLEEIENRLLNESGDIGCTLGITNMSEYSKQIVQEAAEEYKKNDYMNEIQEMALELAVYVLEEEYNKHAWLENANNETGVVVTCKDAICIIKDMLKGSETDEEDI